MSQENELLNTLTDEEIDAYMANPSVEPHIVVGANRVITVPEELKRIAVQFDHNIETVTFDCPRYWDGIDMSQMQIYINYVRPDGESGSYKAQNVSVDSEDANIMHFTWTIDSHVSEAFGSLKFLICIKKTDREGKLVNHWSSDLCTDAFVSEGLECEAAITEQETALITQLLTRMDVVEQEWRDADERYREFHESEIPIMTPRAQIRQMAHINPETGDAVLFTDVYAEFNTFKTGISQSKYVYALEERAAHGTTQRVFRSNDGGETWVEIASLPIDVDQGMWYMNIFVDTQNAAAASKEILYLLKTTTGDSCSANVVCTAFWNGQSWLVREGPALGYKRWLGNNNSISVCTDAAYTKRAVIFGEYGTTTDGTSYALWRTTNSGVSWTKVLEVSGDSNGTWGTGEIRHWHGVFADPYTKHWWACSGDTNEQCKIYRSTDSGDTWDLMFSGSQRERTCGFVFESDYVYYGMDTTNKLDANSVKIVRIDKSKLETEEDRATARTDVATVDNAFAVYGLTRTFNPEGFLVWAQQEAERSFNPGRYILQFYHYGTEMLYPVAYFDTTKLSADTTYTGFYAGARTQNVWSGTIFAKPTTNMQQARYGYSNVSAYIKLNLTC